MSLRLEVNNEVEGAVLPEDIEALLERLLEAAGAAEGIDSGEVGVTFVDDNAIQELNREYRNMDKPTDVLSFSMWEEREAELDIVFDAEDEAPEEQIGDIVISIPTAIRQSEEYGHSLSRELGFLFVHGFLHLLGYDHEDDASERKMTEKQEAILQQVGLSR